MLKKKERKILHDATKTWHCQIINKCEKKKKSKQKKNK